jgi:hypothetical protein
MPSFAPALRPNPFKVEEKSPVQLKKIRCQDFSPEKSTSTIKLSIDTLILF